MAYRISLRVKIIGLILATCLILSGTSLFLSLRQNKIMGDERNLAVRKADEIAMDGTMERHRRTLEKVAVNLLNTDELLVFMANTQEKNAKMVIEGLFLSFQEEGIGRLILYSADGSCIFEQSNNNPQRQSDRPQFLQETYDEAAKDYGFHFYFRGIEGGRTAFPVEYCLVTVVTDDDDHTIGFAELALDATKWVTGIAELTGNTATLYEPESGSFTLTTNDALKEKLVGQALTGNDTHSFPLIKIDKSWLLTDILPITDPSGKIVSHLLLTQDATASVTKSRNSMIFILLVSGCIIILALVFACFVVCKGVVDPIKQVTVFARDMADGHFADSLKITSKDEVADMGDALNNMAKKIRHRAREAEAISTGDLTIKILIESPDDVLGTSLKKIVDNLGEIITIVRDDAELLQVGADKVIAFSEDIKMSSETINDRTVSISDVSQNITEDIEKLASATEEMSASVREISENTARSKIVSTEAKGLSERATDTIRKLDTSTRKIEAASVAISEFADQTNLLALNATIEAARAGDAGKGFAVVASEVKELANQSISTTKSITKDIDEIQKQTHLVVQHTADVAKSVSELDESALVVSAALTEQSAVADELAGTISGTFAKVKTFTGNISDISESIRLNNDVIISLTSSSYEMSELANRLKKAVDRFSLS